jgi:hypothetical protein
MKQGEVGEFDWGSVGVAEVEIDEYSMNVIEVSSNC